MFSEYNFSFLIPNLGKAAEKKDTNEPVKKSKTIFHPNYFNPKEQITLEPNGIVVSAAGTEGSETAIEVSDMVTDDETIVSKVVPMAYRGSFDLDISGAQQPAGASNAARDQPNIVKHDQMSKYVLRVLKCEKCQMVFHSSIHLRAHQQYKHIGAYSAEAAYSMSILKQQKQQPDHLLQNCTATSVSPCMYHPR